MTGSLIPFFLFLGAFLGVYGLIHYYFYRKLKGSVRLRPFYKRLIVVILFFLLTAPILANVTADKEFFWPATLAAYIGYIWMGVLFLFFSAHLAIDIYRFLIRTAFKIFSPSPSRLNLGDRLSFTMSLLMSLATLVYGMTEAQNIRVHRITLKTAKLSSHTSRIRIVQISDIHFSLVNGMRLARKIVHKVKGLDPDILVSTGDLVDRGLEEKERIASLFRGIDATYGKYAVTGNHEFYAGVTQAVAFTEKAGFRMLRNEGAKIPGLLNIVGVDDPTAKRYGIKPNISEDEILKKFSGKKLTILLKHRPRINEKSEGMFDLQLSGHLHKGQIFPVSMVTSILFPYHHGLFKLARGSYLYVTSGTGTWGPPVRFLSPPEITVIEFQKENE